MTRNATGVSLTIFVLASSFALLALSGTALSNSGNVPNCSGTTLQGVTLVAAPPSGDKGPDDLTAMAVQGVDGGHELIWTQYQNGINPDGTPGTPGGPTQSTIAGYDLRTGALTATVQVTGKVDGLTADHALGALIATTNEDVNSAFNLVYPATRSVVTFAYSPDPAVGGNGGTDSIAVIDGQIYMSHSNPNDLTQAATYLVNLDWSTHTADLTPVFFDDSAATSVNTGATVTLALTDPDTNYLMPNASPLFAGNLATVSQGDGLIVFVAPQSPARLSALTLSDNVPGNAPPVDGLAVASSSSGTLLVVDAKAGTIQAFDTSGCHRGTVFVGEPNDNGNPLLGTLNLSTGVITPFGNHFQSPKGILFVPSPVSGDS